MRLSLPEAFFPLDFFLSPFQNSYKVEPLIFLRSFFFNSAFLCTSVIFSITGCFLVFLPTRFTIAYTRAWSRNLYWLLDKIVGLRFQLVGMENLPKGPFILASKHHSMMETFTFPITFYHLCPILKKELTKIPLWGRILKKYGVIAIDRQKGRDALKFLSMEARQVLADNRHVLIFPEGTRSTPGEKGTYQSGVAFLYQDLQVPVVPVAVNTGVFWPKRSFLKYPGVATIQFLPPIQPGLDRRTFLKNLEDTIEETSLHLFKEVTI